MPVPWLVFLVRLEFVPEAFLLELPGGLGFRWLPDLERRAPPPLPRLRCSFACFYPVLGVLELVVLVSD